MKRSQSHSWSPRTSQSPSPLFILIVITVSCLLTFLFIANDFSIFRQGGQHGEFRILIGIMSPYWATARRQVVRNAYSRFPKNLPVDIIFVEGNITAPVNQGRARRAQHTVIEWENSTYGDIMHLDCEENLNKGKTYEFLKKVGREFGGKYSHVMKSDDDAFINLPGIFPFSRIRTAPISHYPNTYPLSPIFPCSSILAINWLTKQPWWK